MDVQQRPETFSELRRVFFTVDGHESDICAFIPATRDQRVSRLTVPGFYTARGPEYDDICTLFFTRDQRVSM